MAPKPGLAAACKLIFNGSRTRLENGLKHRLLVKDYDGSCQ